MRHIFFVLCLLGNLWSFSQTSAASKPIALSEFGDWVIKRMSLDEVANALGTSTQETVTPNETIWQYKFGGDIYTLHFDKDKKLSNVIFLDQVPVSVAELSYEKAKAANAAKTKQKVIAAFGQPHQLAATGNEEVWYYSIADKDGQKGLVIDFDLANAGQIKRYSYSEEIARETALSSSITTAFHVGVSTIGEVEKLLGKPSKRTLESEGEERWYYHSKSSMLAVIFDKQSKLIDFSFQRNPN